jgi:hypothetical protein
MQEAKNRDLCIKLPVLSAGGAGGAKLYLQGSRCFQ